jgi:hypothetical protein
MIDRNERTHVDNAFFDKQWLLNRNPHLGEYLQNVFIGLVQDNIETEKMIEEEALEKAYADLIFCNL